MATAPTTWRRISGEADVTIINFTIARNAAVAHVGGGIWARGNVYVANSTISNNYAEGLGGGAFATGTVGLNQSDDLDNIAPSQRTWAPGERLDAFGSIIGPPDTDPAAARSNRRDGTARCQAGHSLATTSCQRHVSGLSVADGPRGQRYDPMLGRAEPERRRRRESATPARQPASGPYPAGQLRLCPSGDVLEGDQHLAGLVADRLRSPPWTSVASPAAGACVRHRRGWR